MKFLQINQNHCEVAQSLLEQNVIVKNVDMALISEQYRNTNSGEWSCGNPRRHSIIDLTFVNAGSTSGSSWEVSYTYTGSDHTAIVCTKKSRNGPPRVPKTVQGYKIETLDVEMVQMLFEDLSTSR